MNQATEKKEPAKNNRKRPRQGDVVEMDVSALSYGGRALGRVDNYVVFVPYAAPGDRIETYITKSKKSHGEGVLAGITSPSSDRIDPVCPLFTRCGGCSWQHLPVGFQESWKERIVRESIRPVIEKNPGEIDFRPIVSSPESFHYRNKMEFTFGQEKQGAPLKLGFHMPGNWKHILDVEKCWLHPGPLDRLLTAAREEGVRQGLNAWNPVKHEGVLRQLLIRWSVYEQKALIAILTGTTKGFDFEAFRDAITRKCPEIKGVVWGLNAQRSDVARPERILETWGDDVLEERLGDLKFRVSLQSFFQTNTLGAEALYSVAKEDLDLTGTERLFDAYCGTGSIGIFCADQCKEVFGIEIIKEAIWDARVNAQANGLSNCTFMAGDMGPTLPKMLNSIPGQIDRLVVDPPRGGMDKKALKRLAEIQAPVLVYVSCNPTTMARDFEQLIEAGYRIERITPVDMFPQTYHIECVARCVLER